MKVGSEPRPTSEIMDAITELSMTIEVEFVKDENESEGDGQRTDSTAKKHPETAALNPIR